jgi:hypothetical protein
MAYELGRPYGHQQASSDLTVETGNLFGLSASALPGYAAKVTKKLESASYSGAGSQLSSVPA